MCSASNFYDWRAERAFSEMGRPLHFCQSCAVCARSALIENTIGRPRRLVSVTVGVRTIRAHFPFARIRRRRVAALCLLGALGWLLYTIGRSRALLANGRQIAAQSARFPRDYFVSSPNAPALTYLVLGDSTAAGWGANELAATYPHRVAQAVAQRGYRVRVVNVAVGGATLHDVRREQLAALSRVRPDLVTLSVGANDATHFTPLTDYDRELRAVLGTLQGSSARSVLWANTPDMFLAPALPLPLSLATAWRARRQNALLDQSLRGSRVRVVDLYGRGKLDYHRNPALYAADRFHPSARGYRLWAPLFVEQLGAL